MPFTDPSTVPLPQLFDLSGRGYVVTGAGQGIGAAVAARLVESGAMVLVVDHNTERAAEVAERLGPLALPHVADVTDSAAVDAAFAQARTALPQVSGLVNNVGIFPSAALVDLTDDEWDHVVDTGLRSAFLCSRAAAQAMVGTGSGVIVHIGSTESLRGLPRLSHYVAAKHALIGLTHALAVELGPDGIRTITVAPGLIETESTAPFPRVSDPDERAPFERTLPAGRIGQPDDVARVVLVALSDLAAYLTGVVIPVDGGELAGQVRLPESART